MIHEVKSEKYLLITFFTDSRIPKSAHKKNMQVCMAPNASSEKWKVD